jgi:hypothetical protein
VGVIAANHRIAAVITITIRVFNMGRFPDRQERSGRLGLKSIQPDLRPIDSPGPRFLSENP